MFNKSEDGVACFATNLDVDVRSAERYAELFKRRWGIETSYRVENNFRPKTTSKKSGCPPLLLHVLSLRLQPLGDSELDPELSIDGSL